MSKHEMNRSMTGREFDEVLKRRKDYDREATLLGLLIVALVAGTMGAVIGWLARGWLL